MKAMIPAAAFAGLIFGAPMAQAHDAPFPPTGAPAITLHLPDDWTSIIEGGGLNAFPADRTWMISIAVATDSGSLDDVAAEILKASGGTTTNRHAAVNISGFSGFSYDSTMATPTMNLNVREWVVKIGDNMFAFCGIAQRPDQPASDLALGENFCASATIKTK